MVAYAPYFNDARIKSYVRTLEQSGANVDVLAVREEGKGRSERQGNTRIIYLTHQYRGANPLRYVWSYVTFFLAAFLTLSVLAVRTRYRAVHVHNMPNALVFTTLIARLRGARIILDVHDLMPTSYMAKFDVTADRAAIKCLVAEQRLSAWMASHVLCADHLQRDYLERVCAIPAQKLSVMMNLPNEELFRRLKPSPPDDRFNLVYHGTIARRLGIDLMLEAVARINPTVPARLCIYGCGDFLEEAVALAERLGLNGRVFFSRSFFPVEQIPEIVSGMHVGVVANRRTLAGERFMLPVKLLEYVYLKIPVVAPRLEIIQAYFDESMIKYYEPENVADLAACVEHLYRHPEERARLVENASHFYAERDWRTQGHNYLRLLSGN
jgi:glycosyltransferase involved in cell wall biosynthesis